MRLTWKLALLLAIGVGTQYLLNRHADDIDEARFTLRVYVAHLCGGTAADPDVMDLAVELRDREYARVVRRSVAAQGQATSRPASETRDASIAAELESSISLDG
jgi:hypothetical protein